MVTIHGGPAWDVELLAMQLEEAGIDCFLPDKMSKTVDPFITGANPLKPAFWAENIIADWLVERLG